MLLIAESSILFTFLARGVTSEVFLFLEFHPIAVGRLVEDEANNRIACSPRSRKTHSNNDGASAVFA